MIDMKMNCSSKNNRARGSGVWGKAWKIMLCLMLVISGFAGLGLGQKAEAATSYELSGAWKFNDTLTYTDLNARWSNEATGQNCFDLTYPVVWSETVAFTSNGVNYKSMTVLRELSSMFLAYDDQPDSATVGNYNAYTYIPNSFTGDTIEWE